MIGTTSDVALCVAAALEDAHAREDVNRYVDLFDVDATWVTSRGVLIVGRDALRGYLARVMPGGLAGGSVTYRVAQSLPVGDRAAVVVIDQEYRQADGTLKEPGGQHRHTYVVTSGKGPDWAIAAGQNTTFAADV